ncbi:cytochrome P450 [Desarmillaria ectypa]|nr:cytochrome P450 [Desarmillaria ectypa]
MLDGPPPTATSLYLNAPGNPTIIINSAQAAADHFEKLSGNYSDRPASELGEYNGLYEIFQRVEASTTYFQPRAVLAYYPIQMKAMLALLQRLYKSPDVFAHYIRYHIESIVMKTVYGYDADPDGDWFVELVDRALENVRVFRGEGSFLVDCIPYLKYLPRWMPGAKFLRLVRAWRKDVENMTEVPFKYATESVGFAHPSFVSENLTKNGASDNATHLEIVKNTAEVAFAGRRFSALAERLITKTVSVILSAILAFPLYPEVQAKAQAEPDAVIGHGTRLPNFEDRPQLPYIDAFVLEALRWNPGYVLPVLRVLLQFIDFNLGIAHRTVEEDVYRGYYIPAGTVLLLDHAYPSVGVTVISNAWAIVHDEKDYLDPLVFDPDRFIPQEGKEVQPEPTVAFGLGSRCASYNAITFNNLDNLHPVSVPADILVKYCLDCYRVYGINFVVLQGGGF